MTRGICPRCLATSQECPRGDLNGLNTSLQAPDLLARSAVVSQAPEYGRSEEELVGLSGVAQHVGSAMALPIPGV